MLPLHQAYTWADQIVAALAPFCDRIMVAGSIRRARDTVNDIDLVVLPKDGQRDALRARALQRARPVQDGPHNLIIRLANGLQVDIFFAEPRRYPEPDLFAQVGPAALCAPSADHHLPKGEGRGEGEQSARLSGHFTPSNWGSVLLCRTGSKEHNIKLAQAAQKLGLAWKTTLGMEWVPPVMREV